jgi:hypothetical protein
MTDDTDLRYAVISDPSQPFFKVVVHTGGVAEDDPRCLKRLWTILAAPKLLARLKELAPEDPLINEAEGIVTQERKLP